MGFMIINVIRTLKIYTLVTISTFIEYLHWVRHSKYFMCLVPFDLHNSHKLSTVSTPISQMRKVRHRAVR